MVILQDSGCIYAYLERFWLNERLSREIVAEINCNLANFYQNERHYARFCLCECLSCKILEELTVILQDFGRYNGYLARFLQ